MNYKKQRKDLIDKLVKRRYIKSDLAEKAMRKVPRHLFVPEEMKDMAYVDSPQPIGQGQTISAPHMVAIMIEALDVEPGQKILEIGGGMGYHAAVLGEMVGKEGKVYSVEYLEYLAESGKKKLKKAGIKNVQIIIGDGSSGYKENAPYDRISVACGAPNIPQPLIKQLKEKGKILIPVGGQMYQNLIKATKEGNSIKKENLGGVLFVPLKGKYGF